MTVDSVEAESRMEDVSVSSYVWGYVFLNSTQDHTGTQEAKLQNCCMVLDGIICSYRGQTVSEYGISLFSAKQERLASGNRRKQQLPFLFSLLPEGV